MTWFLNFRKIIEKPQSFIGKTVLKYFVKGFRSTKVKSQLRGKRNLIYFKKSVLSNIEVDVVGNDNIIEIDDYSELNNVLFYIRGNRNHIKISSNVQFRRQSQLWIADNDCLIEIDRNSTFEGVHIAVNEPGSKVRIGEDCMFAYDIDIRTGDSHSIIDTTTNKRINYAKDITIGNHVWIAAHCSILKGANIASNSIVATRSVVTKPFDAEGIIIGGSPAKVIRQNITWKRERIYD